MLVDLVYGMARRWRSDNLDEGATAVEYALLVGLIAVIVISSVTLLGGNIDVMFDDIARQLGGEKTAAAS
jgi:pilus assembly protein Flp/PilA